MSNYVAIGHVGVGYVDYINTYSSRTKNRMEFLEERVRDLEKEVARLTKFVDRVERMDSLIEACAGERVLEL
ncbi:MAG: hypothetical protein Q8K86_00220 [Candidatus Nanopelagicaceae bacterium]|nr:hypothetical protein [Candidatus Nanopelagicaceae bacterium]